MLFAKNFYIKYAALLVYKINLFNFVMSLRVKSAQRLFNFSRVVYSTNLTKNIKLKM